MACAPLLTKRARLALLAGYAGAPFLSFPHPLGERVIDLGLIFGWLSPALLIVGVRGLAPGQAAKTAFVAGVCAHAAVLHWLYIVSVVYGHAAPPLGLLAPIGGGIHAGVYVAMFATAWVWLDRRGLASPWSAAVLWVAFEHFRTEGPLGFPWATLGYSQHDNPVLLAWVAYTGVYGMSFALALGGAGLAQAATDLRIRGKMTTGSWVAFAGVAAIFAIGVSLPSRSPEQGADTIRTAALSDHGQIVDNIVYELRGTPCENVVGQQLCFYPDNVVALFPEDRLLTEVEARSYAGTPLFDSDRKPMGLLWIVDTKPITDMEFVSSVLGSFAVRAAGERHGVAAVSADSRVPGDRGIDRASTGKKGLRLQRPGAIGEARR